jgi:hypothetical protein
MEEPGEIERWFADMEKLLKEGDEELPPYGFLHDGQTPQEKKARIHALDGFLQLKKILLERKNQRIDVVLHNIDVLRR